jgi:hypothetical protein
MIIGELIAALSHHPTNRPVITSDGLPRSGHDLATPVRAEEMHIRCAVMIWQRAVLPFIEKHDRKPPKDLN